MKLYIKRKDNLLLNMNTIKLITVRELLGKSFVIPDYQRGYKWTPKQVEDLLDDLDEFISQPTAAKDDFYCLQPLAVFPKIAATNHEELKIEITKAAYPHKDDAIAAVAELYDSKTVWDVIDGQQRLTTVYLLLCYLEQNKRYSIEYKTRPDSTKFLSEFVGDEMPSGSKEENVDFFHMYEVYERIVQWFKDKTGNEDAADKKIAEYKENFIAALLDKTRFIWYEATGDPIQVFTRLNIGKISLTNSELIKALIINNNDDKDNIEITKDWNDIEQQLQNDEFWHFIHSADYNKPTRIDYLFDVLCDCGDRQHEKSIGTDQYRTFRYFDIVLKEQNENPEKSNGAIVWGKLKSLYEVLLEWYNDLRYYHYIGYLMCNGLKLNELYKKWNGFVKKEQFIGYLKEEINKILQGIYKKSLPDSNLIKKQASIDDILNIQYELDGCIAKTAAKPILLLHNIQTVINQNKQSKTKDEFKHTVFYRFPFHLYKTEKWDVEHVDSNTTNNLKDNFSKLIWMLQYYDDYNRNDSYNQLYNHVCRSLKEPYDEKNIKKQLENIPFELTDVTDGRKKIKFDVIASEISDSKDKESKLNPEQKNQIGNFTLLDQSNNRGYGNSIFPSKRKEIMARDRNMAYQLTYDGNNQFKDEPTRLESGNASTFIPPVTRNIFMKYYTPTATNFATWDENDFDGYKTDIESLLEEFFKKEEV